jgi:hypothetical protein
MLVAMGSWLNRQVKKFPVVNEQRWGMVGEACREFLRRMTWLDGDTNSRSYFPHCFRDLGRNHAGLKKVILIEIAAMCNDPRMIIPIEFESEQHQWHADELDWDRKESLLGYHHAFKGGDFPDRLVLRAAHWDKAASGPDGLREIYPRTMQRIDTLKTERPTEKLGSATREEIGNEYEANLSGGVSKAWKQFWHWYGEWFNPTHLFNYLRSHNFRQLAAIFLIACWDGTVPNYDCLSGSTAPELGNDTPPGYARRDDTHMCFWLKHIT